MDLKMLLIARGASLRVKGKIYRACGTEGAHDRGCSCMVAKLG